MLGPYANRTYNETHTVVEFTAIQAGKSVLSFEYADNYSNETVFKKYVFVKGPSLCSIVWCVSTCIPLIHCWSVLCSLHDVARPANVVHFTALNIVSDVVGWLYFIMWSISFYPQVRYIPFGLV